MKIFSKIDKKILIILGIAIIIILLAGVAVYQYTSRTSDSAQNYGESIREENDNRDPGVADVQVEVDGENGGGSFSICLYKCGDGVCQKTDPDCTEAGSANCVCLETPQDCPEDCK